MYSEHGSLCSVVLVYYIQVSLTFTRFNRFLALNASHFIFSCLDLELLFFICFLLFCFMEVLMDVENSSFGVVHAFSGVLCPKINKT